MKSAFGASSCHLLQINSRSSSSAEGGEDGKKSSPNPAMVEYWLGQRGHRFLNVDARREGMGATVITTAETASANTKGHQASSGKVAPPAKEKSPPSHPLDHPLATNEEEDGSARTPSPPALQTSSKTSLVPINESNLATHLTSNDIDRIRIFVRE